MMRDLIRQHQEEPKEPGGQFSKKKKTNTLFSRSFYRAVTAAPEAVIAVLDAV